MVWCDGASEAEASRPEFEVSLEKRVKKCMPLRPDLNGAAVVTRNHSSGNNNTNYYYYVYSMSGTILIPNI